MSCVENISRVEFVVTHACNGHCRHCSEGGGGAGGHINGALAAAALEALCAEYKVSSVMTFGGEPLLYPDEVCAIHSAARAAGVPRRQIITNGCFSRDDETLRRVARMVAASGANDVLLSVDCFHAEHLPPERVRIFAQSLAGLLKGGLRLHPAWVRSEADDNPYNTKTREILNYFTDLGLPHSDGNVIFPSGNAVKHLAEYLTDQPFDMSFRCGDAPYTAPPDCVESISISPEGDVIGCSFPLGNIAEKGVLDILRDYDPYKNRYTAALMQGGIAALAAESGLSPDDFRTPCELCRAAAAAFR